MPQRSQRHVSEVQGRIVLITGISPDTASIAAVGAVGRTVATLSATGGTAPVTYTIANAGGLSLAISGNLLQTTADPVGTVGAKTVGITATDSRGQTKTENIAVTVT
jgi:hypothetical protein